MSARKIVLVEDDQQIGRALTIRLKAAGYEVRIATDGSSGIKAVVDENPDVILLDISMPAGGGFFVAENVQRRPALSHIPIVFITASKAPGLRKRAFELGAAAFLQKPFRGEELLQTIEEAIAGTTSAAQSVLGDDVIGAGSQVQPST
ncbi:MAG: response regulator [Gemmatimonadetes bacterium]|nr:response regulator [Gemmatimonadota bacterium]